MKIEKKNPDHDHSNKYITLQELCRIQNYYKNITNLTSENFALRLAESN